MKKQISKCIKEISSGAYSPQVVFFDWMQCLALAISNTCTLIHNDLWKKREEQYLSTIRKYDKEARYKMSDMVRMLTATYEDTGLSDVLGEVYMESVGGNKNTGQFFTPYHVSLACAELAVPKNINDDRILLHEPSCGSGGMVVATAQVLQKRGINYQKTLDVVCQDLDWSAVYMCYVQFVGQYQKFTMCMSMDIITSCSAPRTPYTTTPENGLRTSIRLVRTGTDGNKLLKKKRKHSATI